MANRSIVLFDGVCNLCNGSVNFIIQRDKKNKFLFGSFQSAEVRDLLKEYNYSADDLSTVLLVENHQLYTQSTAVLKIVRNLGGGWPLLYFLIIIPRPLRDFFYNLIAKNRYKLFGKKEACMIPTPDLKAKFLTQ